MILEKCHHVKIAFSAVPVRGGPPIAGRCIIPAVIFKFICMIELLQSPRTFKFPQNI